MNAVLDACAPTPMLPATSEHGREVLADLANHLTELGERFPEARVEFVTRHTLHAGIYSRTITVPAGTAFVSALMKIPTTVIINGDCDIFLDDDVRIRAHGHRVMIGRAGRKQAYHTHRETSITMCFATQARTVEDAEKEFTDEHEQLSSRSGVNELTMGD